MTILKAKLDYFGATYAVACLLASGASLGCGDSKDDGVQGPPKVANPNVHMTGDKTRGQEVFRFETFGSEGFWTDALRLPAGMVAAKFTPVMALKAGLSVDSDALAAALPPQTLAAVVAELATDLSLANAPLLNDPATTLAMVNANAVIGLSAKDTDGNGIVDVAAGDKVGVTCAFCHAITDKSVFDLATGGSIGKRVDGPAAHTLDVGSSIALGANSRAYFPVLQLQQPDGSTIGRAPMGLTKNSTEAEVDAYLMDKTLYPVGTFDDTVDGNGNPVHNTPMFRADLAAPWGSGGEFQFLDQFANTVYTVLLDPTNLTTPGGRKFLNTLGKAGGDAMVADYVEVLTATNVVGYPYVQGSTTTMPGDPNGVTGIRVDNQKLLDMNAYLNSLPAPRGVVSDAAAVARGRKIFTGTGRCTECHNVDQSIFVPPMIVPMNTLFPGDAPTVLAQRDPPLGPISNTAGSTFDDKQIVVNATIRMLARGGALPLLLDLARKPVFLHDNSVPSLENLLESARGGEAPHPFFVAAGQDRTDVVAFLKSLGTDN